MRPFERPIFGGVGCEFTVHEVFGCTFLRAMGKKPAPMICFVIVPRILKECVDHLRCLAYVSLQAFLAIFSSSINTRLRPCCGVDDQRDKDKSSSFTHENSIYSKPS